MIDNPDPGETVTICPTCGELVDPSDPTVEYGLTQLRAATMGKPNQVVDGLGAFFHRGHFPENSSAFRRAANPLA